MKYLLVVIAAAAAAYCGFIVGRMLASRIAGLSTTRRRVDVEQLLSDRVMSFACFGAAAALLAAALSLWLLPVGLAAAAVLSARMPAYLEKRARRRKAAACEAQLDVLADIVAMGVGAGLSFDAAVDLYCEKFDGELSSEMALSRALSRSGIASRSEALLATAEELGSAGFRRFAETSTQAIERGAPLAKLLSRFAEDMRRQRRAELEQRIAKAPVKMLVPTGLLILPAMLVLVMGPALLQFLGSGF